jgi:hypothetical protein
MLSLLLRGDVEGVRARGGPDWPACVDLAIRHGLGPLLHGRARTFADEWPLPPATEKELRNVFLMATVDTQRLVAAAADAVEGLAAAGVRVAVLKGLHLAVSVYENPAFRCMTDVDLLVPADQLPAARDVLLRAGYQSTGTDDPTLHHAASLARARAAPIELHHELCPTPNPFRIRVDAMWERMVPVSIAGRSALALCPEDLLLHLCVHTAYNHRCLVPLRNVYDIAAVVGRNGDGIDWRMLEDLTRETGTERAVFCGLALARDMFDAPVPAGMLARLVPGADARAALDVARENVLAYAAAGPGWLNVTMDEARPLNLRGLLGRVFAPPSRLLETGGRGVNPLRLAWIYASRPVLLFVRHRKLLGAMLRGEPGARDQLRVARSGAALDAWITGRAR